MEDDLKVVKSPQIRRRRRVVIRAKNIAHNTKDNGLKLHQKVDESKYSLYLRMEKYRWLVMPTFVAACLGYSLLLQSMGVPYAFTVALCGLGNGVVQEHAHAWMMIRLKHPTHSLVLFFLNLRMPHDKERYAQATPQELAAIYLSGPCANFLLMLAGLAMRYTPDPQIQLELFFSDWSRTPEWRTVSHILIATSSAITVMSLLPIPIFDGGQLLKLIFNSNNNQQDRMVAALFSLVGLGFTGWMLWSGRFSPHAVVLAAGVLWLFAWHDKEAHQNQNAIPIKPRLAIICIWAIVLISSMYVMVSIPPAIGPENIQKGWLVSQQNFWKTVMFGYHGWMIAAILLALFWKTSLRIAKYGFLYIWRSVIN